MKKHKTVCKFVLFLMVLLVLLLPVGSPVFAQNSLVPCNTFLNPIPCEPCHIFILAQNILNFVWIVSVPIATLMLAYGGFLMLIPGIGGEKSAAMYTKGRKVLTNAIIGLLIVFAAWLAIDTVIKLVVANPSIGVGSGRVAEIGGYGPWNKINCEVVGGFNYE